MTTAGIKDLKFGLVRQRQLKNTTLFERGLLDQIREDVTLMDRLVDRVERLTGHEEISAEILRQSGDGDLGCKETMYTSHVDTDGNKQGGILTAVVLL